MTTARWTRGIHESVWWAFKNLYDRGLDVRRIQGDALVPALRHDACRTSKSRKGYKDIDDLAVTVKLPLRRRAGHFSSYMDNDAWTLPGNAAAAVNADATYVKDKNG